MADETSIQRITKIRVELFQVGRDATLGFDYIVERGSTMVDIFPEGRQICKRLV